MAEINYDYRFYELPKIPEGTSTDYRSTYSRDYARVLHSPSFRRLQNKTQLFPGQESDFFRNRLTHSLEVSQISKSIARKLLAEHENLDLEPDVCEIAGLVHDIGHPPFGHIGEAALDECMRSYGGFEGNAQTLRILTRLEKKELPPTVIDENGNDCRVGLNLTARAIASALKYDKKIPKRRGADSQIIKGYYESEGEIVSKIKSCLTGTEQIDNFKTIECSIMDIADDIAYSVYDIEDAFKAGFLTPCEILSEDDFIFAQISEKFKRDNIDISVNECRLNLLEVFSSVWSKFIERQKALSKDSPDFEIKTLRNFLDFYRFSKELASNGYYRTEFTSHLINYFINGVKIKIREDCPILSKVYLEKDILIKVNVLKYFSYIRLINSPRLKLVESHGKEIVTKMFNALCKENGYFLLPEDVRKLFNLLANEVWQARVVCDFIAGMTDRYAVEFYCRLFSENPQTIFKPL